MIKCIDNFLLIYNDIKVGVENIPHNIDIMKDNKKKALNYLHSIIYTMETSDVIINKLNKSGSISPSLTINFKIFNAFESL